MAPDLPQRGLNLFKALVLAPRPKTAALAAVFSYKRSSVEHWELAVTPMPGPEQLNRW